VGEELREGVASVVEEVAAAGAAVAAVARLRIVQAAEKGEGREVNPPSSVLSGIAPTNRSKRF
jgi:hypothetical protein